MKRILTFILTFCLLVTFVPFTASAEEEHTEGCYTYEVIDGEAIITHVDESMSGGAVIPETLGGYPVTAIGDWAFAWCGEITSLSIPDCITSIGYVAFRDCTSLASITVDENNPVYHSIGNCLIETKTGTLLKGCANSIIPADGSVMSIGERAFSGYTDLISVSLPDSITAIDNYAFSYCENLTSVNFPDNLTAIGDYAFYGCASLVSVNLPDGVISVGYRAFYATAYYNNEENWSDDVLYIDNHLIEAITTVSGEYEIKDGTKTVAESAFEDCTALVGVCIPDSVKHIGDWAFSYCTSLENVFFENTKGWYADGTYIKAEDLADPEKATEYLTDTYSKNVWAQRNTQHGDLDGVWGVDASDAIYLLYNVFFGEARYPVSQDCDFDSDGAVEAADAIYLLYHVFFGEERYPLN